MSGFVKSNSSALAAFSIFINILEVSSVSKNEIY